MISKITHVTLYVNNQDEALKFYTDKLGMKVHTDTPMDTMRWLTLSPAKQADFELVLMQAAMPEAQALVGKQSPQAPLFCIESDNCLRDVQELTSKGVKIVQECKQEPWGTSAMFLDLYGNMIYMVQPAQ